VLSTIGLTTFSLNGSPALIDGHRSIEIKPFRLTVPLGTPTRSSRRSIFIGSRNHPENDKCGVKAIDLSRPPASLGR